MSDVPDIETLLTGLQAECLKKYTDLGEAFRQTTLLPFCKERRLTYTRANLSLQYELKTLGYRDDPKVDEIYKALTTKVIDQKPFGSFVRSITLADIIEADPSKPLDLSIIAVEPREVIAWNGFKVNEKYPINYALAVLRLHGYETAAVHVRDDRLLFWRKVINVAKE